MAQQRQLLGHVKGDKGDAGKNGIDAKIASATATVTPGHLDEPTCTVEMGGQPGAQTATFAFAGLQGPKGDAGPKGDDGAPGKDGAAGKDGVQGPAGRDANISAVNVTVEAGHSESPTATATVSGDAGDKTISLTFKGLQGATGPAGPAGQNATTTDTATANANGLMSSADKKKLDAITGGAATSVVLANGTTTTIAAMLQANIETIRTALGVATKSKNGLMPALPSNPNA